MGDTAVVAADPCTGYAARLLGRLGFRVVALEPGTAGGAAGAGPAAPGPDGARRTTDFMEAWYFGGAERLPLSAERPADLAAVAALLGEPRVAVFVESWTDGQRAALAARGLSEAALRERHPDLVWLSLTPYGRGQSPERRAATTLFAECGFMSVSGPRGGAPCAAPGQVIYDMASAHGVFAALAALEAVERGRGGASLDVSIMECLAVCEHVISRASLEGRAIRRMGSQHESASPGRVLPARDGWVHIMVAPSSAGHWEKFRAWCGDPRLDDPGFADAHSRRANADALAALVSEHTAPLSRQELFEVGVKLGIPIAPVFTLHEFVERSRQAGRLRVAPSAGGVPVPELPAWCGDTPAVGGVRAAGDGQAPGAPRRDRPGPLGGWRVLDLSHILAGPYATLLMAYMGAEVVKVESPSHPDGYRRRHGETNLESSRPFADFNRSKRDVTADLRTEAGRRRVLDLLPTCDVMIENLRGGALDRLGLTPDVLAAHNPRLSVVAIRGTGPGPWSALAAYGPTVQALCGLTHLWNAPGNPEPVGTQGSFADYVAGIHAAIACLAAVRAARRDGRGRRVEVSMAEAVLSVLGPLVTGAATEGRDPGASGNLDLVGGPLRAVCCADGHWVAVLPAGAGGRGRAGPATPADAPGEPELERVAAGLTAGEVVARCRALGWEAAPVQDGLDLLRDARLRSRGFLVEMEHPFIGHVTFPGCPIAVAGWKPPMRRAPFLGEDDAWLEAEVAAAAGTVSATGGAAERTGATAGTGTGTGAATGTAAGTGPGAATTATAAGGAAAEAGTGPGAAAAATAAGGAAAEAAAEARTAAAAGAAVDGEGTPAPAPEA